MAEVDLMCAAYGQVTVESIFYVRISLDATVKELRKAIVSEMKDASDRFDVHHNTMTLYLARKKIDKKNKWLVDDDTLEAFLQGPVDKEYKKMHPSWQLRDDLYFGQNFAPRPKHIHVLVELPEKRPTKRLRSVEIESVFEKVNDLPQINIVGGQYVTMPSDFLYKCGYKVENDMMLYCRREVHDLWEFMRNKVLANNVRGIIAGSPGSGKSMATLSFVASLDRDEWNVIWINLGNHLCSCLGLGTKEYRTFSSLTNFVLPHEPGKKHLICLDGYKATPEHKSFFKFFLGLLDKQNDRLVACSSVATLGKKSVEADDYENIKEFFMYSWTKDDYIAAIADEAFYDTIKSNLDAMSIMSEVNEDSSDFDSLWGEEEKKMHALDLKFYYAGGSCRFMFQYQTDKVMDILMRGVNSTTDESILVTYCTGEFHIDEVNRLYGMYKHGRGTQRFPVSPYVTYLFAEACNDKVISQLATRLNTSRNPSMDGHLFEWLFLASVSKREVRLFSDHQDDERLPQGNVFYFDPKKPFKVLQNGQIQGNRSWLQPTAWNQGGYDAVYFDKNEGKVIFVQVTRSNTHDFKMRFFYEVLLKLETAKMQITQVVVYFLVKPAQYLNCRIGNVDDRSLLLKFDETWTHPEENHVRVRAFDVDQI